MQFGFTQLVNILLTTNALIVVTIIIIERRNAEKTIAWMLLFLLFPAFGFIVYLLIGRNWKRRKLSNGFSRSTKDMMYSLVENTENAWMFPLIKMLATNCRSPLFINNNITLFKNGIQKFDSLKEELKKAKHHIHLEYFIVRNDKVSNEIKDILIAKAKQGVMVRFIIDKFGSSRTNKNFFKQLMDNGVDVVFYSNFLSPVLKRFNFQINFRNHRKMVIIDGQTGFLGGMNIGDEYLGKGKLGFWRDTHMMIKGDFVLGLQAIFFDDFFSIKKVSRKLRKKTAFLSEALERYYPEGTAASGKMMQFSLSGPNSPHPAVMESIIKMITMAKKNIYISTPYFVPTESVMEAIKIATFSGVVVKILFPGKYDHFIVYKASMTYLSDLCKCGVKIYFYPEDSFLHAKVVTIDGKISTVGSANMDVRSFFLNHELNALIYDEEITLKLDAQFKEDISISKLIECEYFDNMSTAEKFVQSICRLSSSLL